jgi:translocator protein
MTGIASRSQLFMSFLRVALVTVPLTLLLGLVSARLSNSGYGNPWFDALVKPAAMPPGWMFGLAWTLLYILLGLAIALIIHARGSRARALPITLFVLQMLLNYSWSPLFFAAHQVHLALLLLIAIFVIAAVTALLFVPIRKSAALLMAPYLAWLLFAGYLNYEIMTLNPGAESLVPQPHSSNITIDI